MRSLWEILSLGKRQEELGDFLSGTTRITVHANDLRHGERAHISTREGSSPSIGT